MNELDYAVRVSNYDFSPVFRQIIQPILDLFYVLLFTSLSIFFAMLLYALIKYRINFFKIDIEKLKEKRINFQLFNFMRWVYIDMAQEKSGSKTFDQHGFTVYCGRQGSGKTTSMVDYLNRMKKRYPEVIIVTNFKYKYANKIMKDWRDFFEIRNGEKGVIFAIDEIHSELSTKKNNDFPESLLSEISQQRKQRVKIVATAQVYSRVAKQIREQAFTVIQCTTFANRWTFTKEYDALDYELEYNAVAVKKRVRPTGKHSFVQSDFLRSCFDTYEKIERLKGMDFVDRASRELLERE
jgi:ATP-dependent Clp protease ATP-binding subunit ClpX